MVWFTTVRYEVQYLSHVPLGAMSHTYTFLYQAKVFTMGPADRDKRIQSDHDFTPEKARERNEAWSAEWQCIQSEVGSWTTRPTVLLFDGLRLGRTLQLQNKHRSVHSVILLHYFNSLNSLNSLNSRSTVRQSLGLLFHKKEMKLAQPGPADSVHVCRLRQRRSRYSLLFTSELKFRCLSPAGAGQIMRTGAKQKTIRSVDPNPLWWSMVSMWNSPKSGSYLLIFGRWSLISSWIWYETFWLSESTPAHGTTCIKMFVGDLDCFHLMWFDMI